MDENSKWMKIQNELKSKNGLKSNLKMINDKKNQEAKLESLTILKIFRLFYQKEKLIYRRF